VRALNISASVSQLEPTRRRSCASARNSSVEDFVRAFSIQGVASYNWFEKANRGSCGTGGSNHAPLWRTNFFSNRRGEITWESCAPIRSSGGRAARDYSRPPKRWAASDFREGHETNKSRPETSERQSWGRVRLVPRSSRIYRLLVRILPMPCRFAEGYAPNFLYFRIECIARILGVVPHAVRRRHESTVHPKRGCVEGVAAQNNIRIIWRFLRKRIKHKLHPQRVCPRLQDSNLLARALWRHP
jgi:hypothetical protein